MSRIYEWLKEFVKSLQGELLLFLIPIKELNDVDIQGVSYSIENIEGYVCTSIFDFG